MTYINTDPHPGLHLYAQNLRKYPELTYVGVKSHITWERDEDVDPDSIGIVRGNPSGYLEQRMERALMTLSNDELRIIRMLFYSANGYDYAATARTLHRTKRGLRKTLESIYKKLRPQVNDLRCGGDRVYITSKGGDHEHWRS